MWESFKNSIINNLFNESALTLFLLLYVLDLVLYPGLNHS